MAESTSRLSRRVASIIATLALLLTGAVDYATGEHISLLLPYMALTVYAAWTLGERAGVVMAVAAGLTSPILNYVPLDIPSQLSLGVIAWNAAARMVIMVVVALFVNALHDAILLERWRAETDTLTGALNKGAFHARMQGTIEAARRRGAALVLGYLDLDGFKGVNDGHGHSAGDLVLKAFADGVGGAVRHSDLFARIGGDEFVVLLTVPETAAGDGAAEALHARLTRILRGTGFPVTCSMGAIIVDARQVSNGDSMLELADHLMYEVKRTGKNALRIARGDMMGDALRTAFPPAPLSDLDQLLMRIDHAERALAA
ncbi:GGDEF domain-containing protein [Sphingomonas sp. ID0503]|uniref:GGDEF domain-containing protein n=1 Tax=Sphingomonas sp. ID0503 TaxID=3399691 RepID=UPI003AFAFE39